MPILDVYSPCPCNSGKKIKFCCRAIHKTNDPAALAAGLSKLPIHSCLIGRNWKEIGITNVFIARNAPDGYFVVGSFCVDIWCLGVKDADLKMRADSAFLQFIQQEAVTSIPYEDARSVIFGGLSYARKLGFEPHRDWHRAKLMIEPERSFIDKYTFGRDGKPFYCVGPYDAEERDMCSIIKKVTQAGGDWVNPV